MLVIGGGVITGEASAEVLALAEAWKIPVVTTWNGKSGFPEDHPLFAGSVGQTGTMCGNKVASTADVIIAVGCRFTDWSSSSYAKGVTTRFTVKADSSTSTRTRSAELPVGGHLADAKLRWPISSGLKADCGSRRVPQRCVAIPGRVGNQAGRPS